RARCLLRRAHPGQFDVVFGTTHICEGVAEIVFEASVRGDAGDRGPQATAAATTPLFKPAWQFGDVVDAVWDARLGVFGAGPDKLVARHGRQELEPALFRVERKDATGPLTVSQVEVLRVAPERVRAVVSPRNRERLAG